MQDCMGMDQVFIISRTRVLQSNIVLWINVSLPRPSQWLHAVRHESSAACLLGLRVVIPLGVMDVCVLWLLCVVR